MLVAIALAGASITIASVTALFTHGWWPALAVWLGGLVILGCLVHLRGPQP